MQRFAPIYIKGVPILFTASLGSYNVIKDQLGLQWLVGKRRPWRKGAKAGGVAEGLDLLPAPHRLPTLRPLHRLRIPRLLQCWSRRSHCNGGSLSRPACDSKPGLCQRQQRHQGQRSPLPRPHSHRSSVLWILYPLPPHNHEAHNHIDHHHPSHRPHRNPHPPPPRWPWDLSNYQGLLSPQLSKPFRCQLKKCFHGSWLKFWNLQGVIGGEV